MLLACFASVTAMTAYLLHANAFESVSNGKLLSSYEFLIVFDLRFDLVFIVLAQSSNYSHLVSVLDQFFKFCSLHW